jgi:hypothetical protein
MAATDCALPDAGLKTISAICYWQTNQLGEQLQYSMRPTAAVRHSEHITLKQLLSVHCDALRKVVCSSLIHADATVTVNMFELCSILCKHVRRGHSTKLNRAVCASMLVLTAQGSSLSARAASHT